jgi:hypothetical protein
MSDNFLTIATFWNSDEANLARNRLEAAGIGAFLMGEEAVAMAWLLTNAVSGIKLQVAECDAERAQACLAEDASVAEMPWGGEAVTAETFGTEAQPVTAPPEEEEPVKTNRDLNADRAWRGAALGLIFWPLHLYVFYLLLKVYISTEPLHSNQRRHGWMAAAINLPLMFVFCLVFRGWFAGLISGSPP